MCRLGIVHGLDCEKTIAYGLIELEMSMGGHGNGAYFTAEDKLMKGEHLSVGTIASSAARSEGMTIFHTRLASCGGICDNLCHPFEVEGDAGKFVVAHNGHWMQWDRYKLGTERSDTQAMSELVAKHGLGVLRSDAADYSGVWIVWEKDAKRMNLIRRSGEFHVQRLWKNDEKDPKEPFFHASEPLFATAHFRRTTALIRPDVLYQVKFNGRLKERRNVEVVDPTPKWTYTSGAYGTGSTMSNGYYGKKNWIHHRARCPIDNNNNWTCFCTKEEGLCQKCQMYYEDTYILPEYLDIKGHVEQESREPTMEELYGDDWATYTSQYEADLVAEGKPKDDAQAGADAAEAEAQAEIMAELEEEWGPGRLPGYEFGCYAIECDESTTNLFCMKHQYLLQNHVFRDGQSPDDLATQGYTLRTFDCFLCGSEFLGTYFHSVCDQCEDEVAYLLSELERHERRMQRLQKRPRRPGFQPQEERATYIVNGEVVTEVNVEVDVVEAEVEDNSTAITDEHGCVIAFAKEAVEESTEEIVLEGKEGKADADTFCDAGLWGGAFFPVASALDGLGKAAAPRLLPVPGDEPLD